MAKRASLAFPDQGPRGRRAILRTPEEVAEEQRILESQTSGVPESQSSGIPEYQTSGKPVRQSTKKPARRDSGGLGTQTKPQQQSDSRPDRSAYTKVTYRISPDAAEAMDDARRALRRVHNIKATLEEIAEAAILTACKELEQNKESSILVSRLSGKPEYQNSG